MTDDAPLPLVDSHCHLDFPDFDGEHSAPDMAALMKRLTALPVYARPDQLVIVDPRIAPSEGHLELWQYFGIDVPSAVAAVKAL